MHRSSESIAALAAALAKAQSELTNPEKSLVGTIGADRPGEGTRTFRYAPLSTGLDIVRKALGRQQIATVQTTAIDAASGTISLTTVLAHASGEWIASDWPVCRLADSANPHRMGAALTYARRYALFTLVGIAGEDDLDASDLNGRPQPAGIDSGRSVSAAVARKPRRPADYNKEPRRPILDAGSSAVLRDQLVREITSLGSGEDAAEWARSALAAKNALTGSDARLVDVAFELRLSSFEAVGAPRNAVYRALGMGGPSDPSLEQWDPETAAPLTPRKCMASGVPEPDGQPAGIDKSVLTIGEPKRYRDKAHLKFVAARPCLVCGRKPCDPHHLRFAQVRALGRKVSDEFTVPLCRTHHRELHRSGNEFRWWEATGIDPLKIARKLWKNTRLNGLAGRAQPLPRAASTDMATGEPQPVGADRSPSGAP